MSSPTDFNREAFRAMAAHPDPGPVVMVNLLKFRPGQEDVYRRYAANVRRYMEPHGVEFFCAAQCAHLLIGAEEWDQVSIVRYPSRRRFLELTSTEEYREIARDRSASLERAVLYCTVEMPR